MNKNRHTTRFENDFAVSCPNSNLPRPLHPLDILNLNQV